MSDGVVVRLRKVMRNPLLKRRQFVVQVHHPDKAPVSKKTLKKMIADSLGNVAEDAVIVYGFRVAYGGGKSTGFGSAYDSVDEAKKVEPTHRLVREGLGESRSKTRAAWKELKKKKRTTWGTGRRAQMHKKKRADRE